jgi:hypothetical protein
MKTVLTGASVSIVGQDSFTSSSTQAHNLGSYAETNDGRGYRYCLMGAVSSVPGKIYQSSATDATNLTPVGGLGVSAAVAVGGTSVTISTSTTLAANLLANGYLVTDVTPGQGYTLGIKGNTVTAGVAGAVIYLDDPIPVALTTSSKVVLAQHPYANVVVYPASPTGVAVGVANNAIITNAQYGWLQTHGICGVLSGVATSVTAGVPVTTSGATAGSTIVATAVLPTIGWAMHAFTATEYQFIFLTIN